MDEVFLFRLCFAVSILGIVLFVFLYKPEFEPSSVWELTSLPSSKGIIFGRVESVIKTSPTSVFIVSDGNSALVYYSKPLVLEKNDFVEIYAENVPSYSIQTSSASKGTLGELFAQKVVKRE